MKNNSNNNEKKLVVLPLDENSKEISQILANDTARMILETLAEKPLSATEIADKLDLALTTVHYDIKKLEEAGLIRVVDTKASEKLKEVKIYGPEEKFIVIVPKRVERRDALEMLKKILPLIFIAGVFALGIEYVGMEYIYPGDGGLWSMEKGLGEEGAEGIGADAGVNETNGEYKTTGVKDRGAAEQFNITTDDGATGGMENVTAFQESAPPGYAEEVKKEIEEEGGEALSGEPKESIEPKVEGYNPHLGLWFFLGSLLMIMIFAGVKFYRKK